MSESKERARRRELTASRRARSRGPFLLRFLKQLWSEVSEFTRKERVFMGVLTVCSYGFQGVYGGGFALYDVWSLMLPLVSSLFAFGIVYTIITARRIHGREKVASNSYDSEILLPPGVERPKREPPSPRSAIITASCLVLVFSSVIITTALLPITVVDRETPDIRLETQDRASLVTFEDGRFTVDLVNYGVPIEGPRWEIAYFVAQKVEETQIVIKRYLTLHGFPPVPIVVGFQEPSPLVLRENESVPIDISFGGGENNLNLAIQTTPVPSLLGARVVASYRRFSDRVEFSSTGVYQARQSADGWILELPGSGIDGDELSLDEAIPFIEDDRYWTGLTIDIEDGIPVRAR